MAEEYKTPEGKSKQRLRIMKHLRKYGAITSMEAIALYGVMRLSARICELEARGVVIGRERKKGANRYGEAVRYVEYRLIKE